MFKHILESVSDVNWMAIIPLVVFVIFFSMVLVKAIREKKEFIDKMSSLPLEDEIYQNHK